MEDAIIASVLGLLIGAAAIVIPMLLRKQQNRPADDDMGAYQKETGRSAQDIEHGNAAVEARQDNDVRSEKAGGSDGPSSHDHAGSREQGSGTVPD
jgi:hypothetical protein